MAFPVVLIGAVISVFAAVGLLLKTVVDPAPLPALRSGRIRRRGPGGISSTASEGTRRRKHRSFRPTVSVVIPTLNEGNNLGWVLERLPSWVTEVVLVDGLSTDHTEVVARDLLQDVIVVHQPNRGKGAALRAGFAAATSEIIVMIDADGSTNPAEMGEFVNALQEGAEFVKGSRYLDSGGSDDCTRLRSLGNRGFTHMVNMLFGSKFTDLCYGYCAFWNRDVERLALTADGFEIETQLILNAIKAGLEIEEVPSFELPRLDGVSNLNAVRDGLRVLRTIMDERPGSDTRKAAPETRICLVPVERPAPGTPSWWPAGQDRRGIDRRISDEAATGYGGPERRRAQRRHRPYHTVVVYRVVEQPVEAKVSIAA
jgi:hypothetical protein